MFLNQAKKMKMMMTSEGNVSVVHWYLIEEILFRLFLAAFLFVLTAL